jgi:hypothetical protein
VLRRIYSLIRHRPVVVPRHPFHVVSFRWIQSLHHLQPREFSTDETLEELIPMAKVAPLIVVAVANGGDKRTKEYTPWYSSGREAGGGGGKHLKTGDS